MFFAFLVNHHFKPTITYFLIDFSMKRNIESGKILINIFLEKEKKEIEITFKSPI